MCQSSEVTAAALVIGGGPAGTMAATTLAQHGCDVLLVEREARAHHKVCGEFLSQEALLYLRTMSVEPSALGAVPIHAVRLTHGRRTVDAALPFAAMSLTRHRLDEELINCAYTQGASVSRGCGVESLTYEHGWWEAKLGREGRIGSRQVFMASGKHDLRGHARPEGKQNGLIALKMYWNLHPSQFDALREHVELIAYRGGYAGLQPVEGDAANLCCLIEAKEYRRIGGNWPSLLTAICKQSPHLETRLHGAEPLLEKPLAIASLPYGLVRKEAQGLWHLGDQAAVIPSFTGDGMSLALHSGKLAAETYLRGGTTQDFQNQFAKQVKKQVTIATRLSKLLITCPNLAMQAMRFWPGALTAIARQTRVQAKHLLVDSGTI